jgi:hypothetical protein
MNAKIADDSAFEMLDDAPAGVRRDHAWRNSTACERRQ